MSISLPGSVLISPFRFSRRWFAEKRILHKDVFGRNPRCSRLRQICEADISAHVTVDQLAVNFLKKLYCHSPPCGGGVDRRALTSTFVFHCQFFELIFIVRSTSSKSHHRGTVLLPTSCYCAIEKSFF